MKGIIFNIQHFCTDDGPGIRTVVFLKGCNLRCFWCHNPESQKMTPEIQFFKDKCIGCGECISVCPENNARFTDRCTACEKCADVCYAGALKISGYQTDTQDIMEIISENIDIYTKSSGGVTFSGGEPLLQYEFLAEMIEKCKEKNIHTAIETAMCIKWEYAKKSLELADLIFCDIKAINDDKHRAATGVSNRLILENIQRLSEMNKKFIIRIPVVPGFNDMEMKDISDFVNKLPNVPCVELLPFHGICVNKYKSLNRNFEADNIKTPTAEKINLLYKHFI